MDWLIDLGRGDVLAHPWMTFTFTLLIGLVGAGVRCLAMRLFNYDATRWMELAASASSLAFLVAVVVGSTNVIMSLMLLGVTLAVMWLGALTLGARRVDLMTVLAFSVGAALVVALPAIYLMLALWDRPH